MIYKATVNGKEQLLDFVPGKEAIEQITPGVYSILRDGKSYRVHVTGSKGSYEVNIAGHSIDVLLEDPRDAASSKRQGEQEGRIVIKSAMPGKVVRVLVAEGDSVEPGQGLIVVEAMKMQNELKSPKTGRVVKIETAEGATVQAGQVLVVLE